jgi:Uma2 family endonuclease
MAAEITRRRFTVDDYHRLAAVGILMEDDRVELVDGDIVTMSPIGARHAGCVTQLEAYLHRSIGDVAQIRAQNPLQLGTDGEPEPDIAVVRPRADYYKQAHPTPMDVFMLMEVADSSLDYDRSVKLPLYAGAQIRETWLVDLEGGAVERHTNPVDGSYRLLLRAGRGETVESTTVPGLVFRVEDVLG